MNLSLLDSSSTNQLVDTPTFSIIPISNVEGLYFFPSNNEIHCFDSTTGWNAVIESFKPNELLEISKYLEANTDIKCNKEVIWLYEAISNKWFPDHLRANNEPLSSIMMSKDKKEVLGCLSVKGLIGTEPSLEDRVKIELIIKEKINSIKNNKYNPLQKVYANQN